MIRKENSAVEGDPKKSWSGIETEASRRLAWWGSTEKNKASYSLGLRGRHQCSNRNRAPYVASTAVGTEGEEDQMARLSA